MNGYCAQRRARGACCLKEDAYTTAMYAGGRKTPDCANFVVIYFVLFMADKEESGEQEARYVDTTREPQPQSIEASEHVSEEHQEGGETSVNGDQVLDPNEEDAPQEGFDNASKEDVNVIVIVDNHGGKHSKRC